MLMSIISGGYAAVAMAETPCGNIIYPTNYYYEGSPADVLPVSNCDNPFSSTGPITNFLMNGITVSDSMVIESETPVVDYGFSGESYFADNTSAAYFRHEGTDYIATNVSFLAPSRAEYESATAGFLGDSATPERVAFYVNLFFVDDLEPFFSNDDGPVYDEVTGDTVSGMYGNLAYYFENHIKTTREPLAYGTYTAVVYGIGDVEIGQAEQESRMSNQNESGFGTFLTTIDSAVVALVDAIIPAAYAATGNKTVTFTIAPPATTTLPVGASSILFLPGIQASRLYTDGLLGTEDQLWTPQWNQDVRQLSMTSTGQSNNGVYTRDVLDRVVGLGTVYGSFMNFLDNLVSEEVIESWEAFAYDWRYAVDHVARAGTQYEIEIKNAVEVIENLASSSYSGKVTIVAHSNGGLLAKAVLSEMERLGNDSLVDGLVLLASPQLGTPKAIGTLLHGFDQSAGGNLIIDAALTRTVIQNLPGAYGLLPTQEYFDTAQTRPIRFASSTATQSFINTFGQEIDTYQELFNFMIATDGRSGAQTIYDAEVVNQRMLYDAKNLHESVLQPWRAPAGLEVLEVVGVGLPTVSGFEYRQYQDYSCTQEPFTETCTTKLLYKPVPVVSAWGDETVIADSARGYKGDKSTFYFDLLKQDDIVPIRHVNFTEALSVQQLLKKYLIHEPLTDIDFITNTPVVAEQEYLLIASHSPVRLRITDENGIVTEVIQEGDFYNTESTTDGVLFRLGSTTYAFLPSESDYDIEMIGTGYGGVTLSIDVVTGDSFVNKYSVWLPLVAPGTKIVTRYQSNILDEITVDVDGDGNFEKTVNPDTGVIDSIVDKELITPQRRVQGGTKTRSFPEPLVAGAATSSPEVVYNQKVFELLVLLQKLVSMYEKNR